MIDFTTALKARLPFIAIHTDDVVNVKAVLQALSGKPIMLLPTNKTVSVGDSYLFITEDLAQVTVENYRKLCEATATCVVINPDKPSSLVFEGGVLPVPEQFYCTYLKNFVTAEAMPVLVQVLKGLSLKAAQEVVQLTMARTGSILPHEVRKTRQMLGGEHPGLTHLDTTYDFYEWPKVLREWLDLNTDYFLDPSIPTRLVPRGLMLAGEPGTGKSMAAMVIAKHWDVPLFRLDISSSLNRYLGESESRIARNLALIEQSAPCVWLLDEAEKLFGIGGDEGTTHRILSQILWWLQYHRARVLTIMTTNDLPSLPKELYRAERVDRVIQTEKLPLSAAKLFAAKAYESLLGRPLSMKRQKILREALDTADKGMYAHADVRVRVAELIKQHHWLQEEK